MRLGMLLLDGSENMFGVIRIMTGFLETFTFTTTEEYKDERGMRAVLHLAR